MQTQVEITNDVYVHLEQCAASDAMVVKAARVSTEGLDALLATEKRGLINYLTKNRHGSPFEHGMFTFVIQAPIFVAREFMRHRAGWSYNEESGRYKVMGPLFYIPGAARNLVQIGKTGSYSFELGDSKLHRDVQNLMVDASVGAWDDYTQMLDWGVAKEVARMTLPLNLMTTFFATCNPRSLMHFLSLRTQHDDATFVSKPMTEINMVADRMEEHFATIMPYTYDAYVENGRVCP